MNRPLSLRLAAGVGAAALALSACGGGSEGSSPQVDASNWDAVLAEAEGQTVSWHMFGGDDALNSFVDDELAPRLAELGVTLDQVRITDTADAVNTVLGEQRAGRASGGAVDAIWINGENFATGVQADLWACGWADDLPNAQFVDAEDPAVSTDFGVPVNGCESVWQQASSALVYDSAELEEADVASVGSLLGWARDNPGRFTYPAPPDFTGSMAVRSILYAQIDGPDKLPTEFDEAAFENGTAPLWKLLNDIEPTLWRGGETYPTSQADVEKLYSDGEISAYFTYGPGAVAQQVEDGTYPDSTRQAVPASGNISNVSYLAIPSNSDHQAGALVLANVLQDPEVQLALYEATGAYPGIDVARTPAGVQQGFAAVRPSASVLSIAELNADAQPELASGYISRIEDGWRAEVLQR